MISVSASASAWLSPTGTFFPVSPGWLTQGTPEPAMSVATTGLPITIASSMATP